ncbi:MAG: YceI family protein [Gemmatimonadaceae bacterium]|nr:YceI family protein [Gemmatimonadaceae bacterium]
MLKVLLLALLAGIVGASSEAAAVQAPGPQNKVDVRYRTSGEGNKARYRVRERLIGKELDNDAVGETPVISGTIALDRLNMVVADESGFSADVSKLKSSEMRRDKFVRSHILMVDSFPVTTFRATAVKELSQPLPNAGNTTFRLVGDLTVKGVTRPTTWVVTAFVNGDKLTGQAITRFTFKEFGIRQPRLPILHSVADTITLEYDFVMTRQAMKLQARQ